MWSASRFVQDTPQGACTAAVVPGWVASSLHIGPTPSSDCTVARSTWWQGSGPRHIVPSLVPKLALGV
ncbi:hypothetical protein HaLaN_23908, partial [Haematococcus lacustris]